MEALSEKDIGSLWRENYPRHKDDAQCESVCRMLASVIRDKAKFLFAGGDLELKLKLVLDRFEIPKTEFDEFETQ